MRVWTATLLATAVLTAGCSPSRPGELSADDPVFAGLDRGVVLEVLASPAAQSRVQGDDAETARARYQNMVRNFVACRSALTVYQEWLRVGVAPAFPRQPRPDHPTATARDMDSDIAQFVKEATSGDISLLRAELTSDTGCGAWIPARNGDAGGPTIADVLRGKG